MNIDQNSTSLLPHDLFQQILAQYLSARETTIVQVGACDGVINDPIYRLVMERPNSTRIVLIEPQSAVIPILKSNYKEHPNALILNCAVGRSENLQMFRLKREYHSTFRKTYLENAPDYRVPSGFTSSSYQHVEKHVMGRLPDGTNIDDSIEIFTVPAMKLSSIIDLFPWKERNVDILQIDAEGTDDEVIYSCDVHMHKPDLINFEHVHLSSERYERVCDHLMEIGYNIFHYSISDTLAAAPRIRISAA